MSRRTRSSAAASTGVPQTPAGRLRQLVAAFVVLAGVGWWSGAWAWAPLDSVRRSLDRHDSVAAADQLAWAERLGARQADLAFWRARVARQEGRLRDMRELLRQADRLKFDRERLRREELLAVAQTGETAGLEPQLTQLLLDDRGDLSNIVEAMVNGTLLAGKVDAAVALIDDWQRAAPHDPLAWVASGRLAENASRGHDAEAAYRRAVSLDARCPAAKFGLARSLRTLGRPAEALPLFSELARRRNGYAAQAAAAECLQSAGQVDEALARLRLVVTADPRDVELSYRCAGHDREFLEAELAYAQLLLAKDQPEEAIIWLRKALEHNPRFLDARFTLSTALRKLGRTDEAQAELSQVQSTRAALAAIDREVDAIGNTLGIDLPAAYTRIGRVYLEHGSKRTGADYLKRALAIEPGLVKARELLADYLESRAADTDDDSFAHAAAAQRKLAEAHRRHQRDPKNRPVPASDSPVAEPPAVPR